MAYIRIEIGSFNLCWIPTQHYNISTDELMQKRFHIRLWKWAWSKKYGLRNIE